MNSRKENETFYQNNTVELNDEALAKVIGGGDGSDCNHGWGNGWGNSDGNGWGNGNGNGYGGNGGRGSHHCPGLLGDLLGDLL